MLRQIGAQIACECSLVNKGMISLKVSVFVPAASFLPTPAVSGFGFSISAMSFTSSAVAWASRSTVRSLSTLMNSLVGKTSASTAEFAVAVPTRARASEITATIRVMLVNRSKMTCRNAGSIAPVKQKRQTGQNYGRHERAQPGQSL